MNRILKPVILIASAIAIISCGAPKEKNLTPADVLIDHLSGLIDDGKYMSARQLLMGISTRCAEWNYLFGAVLLRMALR